MHVNQNSPNCWEATSADGADTSTSREVSNGIASEAIESGSWSESVSRVGRSGRGRRPKRGGPKGKIWSKPLRKKRQQSEIVILVPGETTLDLENSEFEDDGVTIAEPVFNPSQQTLDYSNQVADVMKQVEEEMFDGMMEGRVEIDLAPYWSH